jgi:hypothetical protein
MVRLFVINCFVSGTFVSPAATRRRFHHGLYRCVLCVVCCVLCVVIVYGLWYRISFVGRQSVGRLAPSEYIKNTPRVRWEQGLQSRAPSVSLSHMIQI